MPPRPRRQRPMQRPERPRHPHRPLQLHVHVVLEAIRHERKDNGRENAGRCTTRQHLHQHEHADTGRDDGAEQQDVVHEHRRNAGPQQRRADETFDDHRVGVGQSPRFGVEDVAVEDVRRRRRERVREPPQAPHVEVDVLMFPRARAEVFDLRPRHGRRQRDEQQRYGDKPRPRRLEDCRPPSQIDADQLHEPQRVA